MILHTTIVGTGIPLVLLHSGGMTGGSEYEEQSKYFSELGYQVIRPDLRGHGKSVGPFDNFFERTVNDLNDTLQDLNIDSCHIAGVSVGGVAALLFAKKYPQKTFSLIISGISPTRTQDYEESLKEEQSHYESLFTDQEISKLLTELHTNNNWQALLTSFNDPNFYPHSKIQHISSMATPTLCIVGDELEREVAASLEFKRLQPNIHLSIIPFAGHLVHRDQPDFYNLVLELFLNKIRG